MRSADGWICILGGDDDGVPEAGEIKISLELAKALINASDKQAQDGRWMLGRDAVATELDFLAGNPGGDKLPDDPTKPNDDDPCDFRTGPSPGCQDQRQQLRRLVSGSR